MDIQKINRELVRVIKLSGLKAIDDYEDMGNHTVLIDDIYQIPDRSSKDTQNSQFHTVLYLIVKDTNKSGMYELSEILKKNLQECFFEGEYINKRLSFKKETARKINTDIGKFYQYSFDVLIRLI